MKNKKI